MAEEPYKVVDFGIERPLGECLALVARRYQRELSGFLTRRAIHGLRWPLLQAIQVCPGCTQHQLSDQVGFSEATTGYALKALERRGLVFRRSRSEAREADAVFLSDEGRSVVSQTRRFLDAFDARFFAALGLSSDEQDRLGVLLSKMSRRGPAG